MRLDDASRHYRLVAMELCSSDSSNVSMGEITLHLHDEINKTISLHDMNQVRYFCTQDQQEAAWNCTETVDCMKEYDLLYPCWFGSIVSSDESLALKLLVYNVTVFAFRRYEDASEDVNHAANVKQEIVNFLSKLASHFVCEHKATSCYIGPEIEQDDEIDGLFAHFDCKVPVIASPQVSGFSTPSKQGSHMTTRSQSQKRNVSSQPKTKNLPKSHPRKHAAPTTSTQQEIFPFDFVFTPT